MHQSTAAPSSHKLPKLDIKQRLWHKKWMFLRQRANKHATACVSMKTTLQMFRITGHPRLDHQLPECQPRVLAAPCQLHPPRPRGRRGHLRDDMALMDRLAVSFRASGREPRRPSA